MISRHELLLLSGLIYVIIVGATSGDIIWCDQQMNPVYNLASAAYCDQPVPLIKLPMPSEMFEDELCKVFTNRMQPIRFDQVDQYYYGGGKNNNRASNAAYMVLKWALIRLDYHPAGLWLEFGVASGFSSNITSILRRQRHPRGATSKIYGFDWFRGLPEAWADHGFQASRFSRGAVAPPTQPDVEFVHGLFNATLPEFLVHQTTRAHANPDGDGDGAQFAADSVSFVNIDMDLFDGAAFVLETLYPHLRRGSLLHFHELVRQQKGRGPNREGAVISRGSDGAGACRGNEELRALYEWLGRHQSLQLQLLPVQSRSFESVLFMVKET